MGILSRLRPVKKSMGFKDDVDEKEIESLIGNWW